MAQKAICNNDSAHLTGEKQIKPLSHWGQISFFDTSWGNPDEMKLGITTFTSFACYQTFLLIFLLLNPHPTAPLTSLLLYAIAELADHLVAPKTLVDHRVLNNPDANDNFH